MGAGWEEGRVLDVPVLPFTPPVAPESMPVSTSALFFLLSISPLYRVLGDTARGGECC